MEERPAGEKRRLNTWRLVIGIAMAAILAFTLLSVFFYGQAMDYRASKYKAQYVLVEDILEAIPLTVENITDIVDDGLDTGWRRSAALATSALSSHLAESCYAVQVMYKSDDEKHIVFSMLRTGFSALSNGAYRAYVDLSSEFGPELEHDIDEELGNALNETSEMLDMISTAMTSGIDYGRDWSADPYDLLDGMDMVVLWSMAGAIDVLFP